MIYISKAHTLDLWCNECGCIHLDKVLADENVDIPVDTKKSNESDSDLHQTN